MEPDTVSDDQADVFGITNIGNRRKTNQDHFLISSLHKTLIIHGTSLPDDHRLDLLSQAIGYFLVVADGVGGTAGGEEASSMTLQTLAAYVTGTMKCYYARDLDEEQAFLGELADSVGEIHSAVVAEGNSANGVKGMASTLTMAIVVWPKAYIVQVGDSRCYLLTDGKLQQVTRDQTFAQDLAAKGAITPEQAEQSHLNNILSSAVGGPEAKPVTSIVDLRFLDTLLLCSDGLTKHVSDETIRDILDTDDTSEVICQRLIDAALEGGGTDNVTVVIGRSKRP
jgi:serine/threonine protein phosphatase PrpC